MKKNRGDSGPHDWVPPEDYLQALRRRVLPIYGELLEDPFLRHAPYHWSNLDRAESEPPDLGPWELGEEPVATDIHFLLHNLEGRVEELTAEREKVMGMEPHEFFARELENRRRKKKAVPIPRKGYRGTWGDVEHRFALQISLRDAVLEALHETGVHEGPGGPDFRVLLDLTVRTLHHWASWGELADRWWPPALRWEVPGHPLVEVESSLPLRDQLEAATAEHERRPTEEEHRRNRHEFTVLLKHPGGILSGGSTALTDSEALPIALKQPRHLRAIMWAILTLQERGQAGGLEAERSAVESLGEYLSQRDMDASDRWRRERVLSDWIHELRQWEMMARVAERTLAAAGLTVKGKGSALDAQVPSGTSGGQRDLFGQLVLALYERYQPREKSGRVRRLRTPDRKTLERIARLLSPYYPEEWLRTDSKSRLYTRIYSQTILPGRKDKGSPPHTR